MIITYSLPDREGCRDNDRTKELRNEVAAVNHISRACRCKFNVPAKLPRLSAHARPATDDL